MNRKQRRAMQKLSKQKSTQKLGEKMMQFDKLPDQCSACLKAYDKKNKQMAMTWSVVVKEEKDTVRLYCPDCWNMANEAIETLRKEIENVSE